MLYSETAQGLIFAAICLLIVIPWEIWRGKLKLENRKEKHESQEHKE